MYKASRVLVALETFLFSYGPQDQLGDRSGEYVLPALKISGILSLCQLGLVLMTLAAMIQTG